MRIASRFQRPGRSNDRRARASTAGIWLGLISLGCFFELEPVDLDGGIGGGGSGGSLGGAAGETPVGGDGGGGVAGIPPQDDCEQAGQKRCNGQCVIANPTNGCGNEDCTECASLPNAAPPTCGGDSGRCQITSCNPGSADCDADLAEYTGESGSSNGCEYSFGTIADPSQLLAAPRVQQIQVDGSRDDWGVIPAYRLEQTCVDCDDDVVVFQQPTAQNEPPPSSDLSAYFRVAWDADSFYVLAEVFDDFVFKEGSSVDGACQPSADGNYVPGPMCEDALAVYFDGAAEADRNRNYGNVAHRILLGTSEVPFLPAQGQPPVGTIGLRVLQANGPRCYRMEAQFPWTLLVSNQGEPVADKFPPAAGQTYGFDVAVSDWDPTISDPSIVERQSQLFFTPRAAQSKLHESIAGVGSIVLTDHASSDVAGSPQ
jgi:hypothetical protein